MKGTVSVIITLLLAFSCFGATIYVDDDAPSDPGPGDPAISDPCEDGSTAHPFDAIQEGIDAAFNSYTVVVADGTYTDTGNRDIYFRGKAITVRSENGPADCIVDCNGTETENHRGFIFDDQESNDSILSGFTIHGGFVTSLYGGGGIFCENSGPTIQNCVFYDNVASTGYYASGGAILAIYNGMKIDNCTFNDNHATEGGGAVAIVGCTGFNAHITNSIVWGNSDPDLLAGSIGWCGNARLYVDYSDVQGGWTGAGVGGNIDTDPCFVDAPGADFHLKSQAGRYNPNTQSWVADSVTSLCIDAGDPADPVGLEPFPNGGIINMGAYGGTAQASKSYFGEPVCSTIVAGDINGDCKINLLDFMFISRRWLNDYSP